jgi:ribonuclease I
VLEIYDASERSSFLEIYIHASASLSLLCLSSPGLWPNYDPALHDGMAWPQYCARPDGEAFTDCEANSASHAYCTPTSALDVYNDSSTSGWQEWALEYSWSDLASHEWAKHGSCTLWEPVEYFGYVKGMYDKASQGSGGALVAASAGASVGRAALAAAFAADLDGKLVAFNCDPKTCALTEVWTAWNLDPTTLAPTTPRDYADDSPCPVTCTDLAVVAWLPEDGSCPPTPPPTPNNATSCEPSEHGPVCANDDECELYGACVRCASSGYCTDVPL